MAASFEIMGAFGGPVSRVVQFGSGDPEVVHRASGTADVMRVMGIEPAIRNPEGGDQFISHAFWMRRFGGDPAAASGVLVFEGHALAIGGVMPRGFDFPAGADMWGLMSFEEQRATRDVNVIARLRKDRTLAEARAELRTIAAALAAAHPAENAGWDVEIGPLHATIVADATSIIWLLHGAVSLTLLIAVINVGGLFLAHAVARRREMAVRMALGAPARRLLGQQAIEAALLVTAGTLGRALGRRGGRVREAASHRHGIRRGERARRAGPPAGPQGRRGRQALPDPPFRTWCRSCWPNRASAAAWSPRSASPPRC
jgi:putative ABC transport system permease protein